MKRLKLAVMATIGLTLLTPAVSHAIPVLQLYIEGSTYDASTETWETTSSDFTLWVLGNVGASGTILDVKLSAAYDDTETGTITITPTTATPGILPAPGDPSISGAVTASSSGDGNAPLMGDGSPLPSHGIFGPGTAWQSWALGDFNLTDSPIGDFTTGGCPDDAGCTYPSMGQINAYNVSITGYTGVHFDAFDHIGSEDHFKYKFAPFSHDAAMVPEPGSFSLMLMGSGLLGAWIIRRRFSSSAEAVKSNRAA